MISWPYILGALVAVFILGCANGYAIRDGSAKAAAVKAYKAQIAVQERLNNVSTLYEAERERASRVATERTNTVREYYRDGPAVPAECGVPDPMFGLLISAVRDYNAAAESGEILPSPAGTGAVGP
jgi:hypothetical protein